MLQSAWTYRVAGHLAQAIPATRRLLAASVTTNASCTPSTLAVRLVAVSTAADVAAQTLTLPAGTQPEFDCMLAVMLPGDPRDPPPGKQFMHWSLAHDDVLDQPGEQ